MQSTTPIQYVPTCGGKASPFLDFEQRVMLRAGSTDIPVDERATRLILHMDAAARQVCLHSGGDALMEGGDVMTALQALRDSLQPDATGRISKQVDKCMTYKRTDQPFEMFLAEFGISRRIAGKHPYSSGSVFPDLYVTFFCIRAAQPEPGDKTLLMASMAGNADFVWATTEDILQAAEDSTQLTPQDLSNEA